ncbi:MAG: RseA family anti-sigma factor [Pirellulales bacterium]
MSLELNSDLLSAYLDGELNDSQRQQVENALSKNLELQNQFNQLAQASSSIGSLPEQTLKCDLTDSIMRRIEDQKPSLAVDVQVQPRVGAGHPSKSNSGTKLSWVGIGIGIAAAFVGLLAVPYALWTNDDNVAVNPPVGPSVTTPVVPHTDIATVENNAVENNNVTSPENMTDPIKDPAPISVENNNPQIATTGTNNNTVPVLGDPKTKNPGFRINIVTNKPNPSPKEDPKTVSPGSMLANSLPKFPLSLVGGFTDYQQPEDFTDAMQDELIAMIDVNNDEVISDIETYKAYKNLQKALTTASKEQAKLLNQIDQDDDAILLPNEANSAVAFVRFTQTETGKKAGIIFNRLDANDDGKWNEQDFEDNLAFLQMSSMKVKSELEQTLIFVDRNHDGDVGFIEAEFAADHLLNVFTKYDGKILDPSTYNKTMQLFNQLDRDKNGRLTARERARDADVFSNVEIPANKTLSTYELYQQLELESISL